MIGEITKETRSRFLDAFGFAQLASQSSRLDVYAMGTMYRALLDKEDGFISNAVNLAAIAKQQILAKQAYDQAKKAYEAEPEKTRGEFKGKDPGQPDQNLTQAFIELRNSTNLYASKRQEMIVGMSPSEMLTYNSTPDGKPIISIPENIETLLKGSTTPLKNIEDKKQQELLFTAISATDDYKIHGILNAQVERELAQGRLEQISAELKEEKAPKK